MYTPSGPKTQDKNCYASIRTTYDIKGRTLGVDLGSNWHWRGRSMERLLTSAQIDEIEVLFWVLFILKQIVLSPSKDERTKIHGKGPCFQYVRTKTYKDT